MAMIYFMSVYFLAGENSNHFLTTKLNTKTNAADTTFDQV